MTHLGLDESDTILVAAERAVGRAWMLLCTLDPDAYGGQLRDQLEALDNRYADRVEWWRRLRDAPKNGYAQLVGALLGHSAATREGRHAAQNARRARLQKIHQTWAVAIWAGVWAILMTALALIFIAANRYSSENGVDGTTWVYYFGLALTLGIVLVLRHPRWARARIGELWRTCLWMLLLAWLLLFPVDWIVSAFGRTLTAEPEFHPGWTLMWGIVGAGLRLWSDAQDESRMRIVPAWVVLVVVIVGLAFIGSEPSSAATAASSSQSEAIASSSQDEPDPGSSVTPSPTPEAPLASTEATASSSATSTTAAPPLDLANTVMFVSEDDLFTVKNDGTELNRLTSSDGRETDPAWSPDGRRIAFSAWSVGDPGWRIFVVDSKGSSAIQISPERPLSAFQSDYDPAWSPDGTRIAFTCGNQICISDPDGSSLTYIEYPEFSEGGGGHPDEGVREPSWSPDGTKIVFVALNTQPTDEDLYIAGADGSGLRRLTDLDDGIGQPAWSPNGDWIVFMRREGSGRMRADMYRQMDLWRIRPDGTDLSQLTDSRLRNVHPSWSPDGSQIVFVSDREVGEDDPYGGRFRLFVMDADGSNQQRVSEAFVAYTPAWSPIIDESAAAEDLSTATEPQAQVSSWFPPNWDSSDTCPPDSISGFSGLLCPGDEVSASVQFRLSPERVHNVSVEITVPEEFVELREPSNLLQLRTVDGQAEFTFTLAVRADADSDRLPPECDAFSFGANCTHPSAEGDAYRYGYMAMEFIIRGDNLEEYTVTEQITVAVPSEGP